MELNEQRQQQMIAFMAQAMQHPALVQHLMQNMPVKRIDDGKRERLPRASMAGRLGGCWAVWGGSARGRQPAGRGRRGQLPTGALRLRQGQVVFEGAAVPARLGGGPAALALRTNCRRSRRAANSMRAAPLHRAAAAARAGRKKRRAGRADGHASDGSDEMALHDDTGQLILHQPNPLSDLATAFMQVSTQSKGRAGQYSCGSGPGTRD